jgi:phosphomannomutase
MVLEDDSCLMIRPSDTEPNIRFYIEARKPDEIQAIFETAEQLTKIAISGK